jgi:hypothetical protein
MNHLFPWHYAWQTSSLLSLLAIAQLGAFCLCITTAVVNAVRLETPTWAKLAEVVLFAVVAPLTLYMAAGYACVVYDHWDAPRIRKMGTGFVASLVMLVLSWASIAWRLFPDAVERFMHWCFPNAFADRS